MKTNNFYKEHYYRLIGKLVVEFNKLDDSVARYICRLLDVSDNRIELSGVFSYLGFGNKIQILQALLSRSTARTLKSKSLLKNLKSIQGKRNSMLHSSWFLETYDDIDDDVMVVDQKKLFHGRGKKGVETVLLDMFISKRDLLALIKEIEATYKQVITM